MKITILQRNIEWANPQANVARADEAISCLQDADLFVLPEMFSTGFCTQPEGIAESADSETLHLSLIHISEPTRQAEISYAVFCLKKKKKKKDMTLYTGGGK